MVTTSRIAELFSAETFQKVSASEFGPSAIRALADKTGMGALRRKMRLRLIFDKAYEHLRRNYRNEYVYKNTLTNSLLLANHTLCDGPKAARLLTEFWVGEAKADLAIINGTSTVYEIKTELDDLARLPNQLRWYSLLFDKVYVVTSPKLKTALAAKLPDHVGIMLLTDDSKIRCVRRAQSNKHNASVSVIFRSLRQLEVLALCHAKFGVPLDIPNGLRGRECWKHFSTLTPIEAHDAMVELIRARSIHPEQHALIAAAPHSLKHMCVAKTLNISQYRAIRQQLDAVA